MNTTKYHERAIQYVELFPKHHTQVKTSERRAGKRTPSTLSPFRHVHYANISFAMKAS